ncbi:alpha/beta hydrolase [Aquibacillus koreensis]|uniref:Alpha/beta hydrolase n=1 Tax=Aquibacillus koreensis TaxID=279446 RepID=A0A9X4AJL0_9BACI|nr:alpha/beta hydrolase [Aquibacillus koreensis]MCT2535972.1 alpha/beta hydrolase [Aquibacillus koreensis]MDC3420428.1 alpha/beta hydrolase [Aquibacillus koreensis]
MKRKLWISLLVILSVFFIALIIGGNYFYSESVKRGIEVSLHKEDESVTAFAEQPNPLLDEAKAWFETNKESAEQISITSYDDLNLHANFFKNTNSTGKAVILAHGYRGHKEQMGDLAQYYYEQGFDILMPDARGHGESEGEYIGYGWHDRLDYTKWIDWLIAEHETDHIFLQGNSMGASLVLMTSGEELPEQVKGIIADSGYTSVLDELSYQLKHLYSLPSFPIMQVTSVITNVRAGYTFEEASAIDQVKKNTKPLLLVHGDADELVPTEMAYELYDAASGTKELWIVPKAGHTKAYDVATQEYQERLNAFIQNTLEQ